MGELQEVTFDSVFTLDAKSLDLLASAHSRIGSVIEAMSEIVETPPQPKTGLDLLADYDKAKKAVSEHVGYKAIAQDFFDLTSYYWFTIEKSLYFDDDKEMLLSRTCDTKIVINCYRGKDLTMIITVNSGDGTEGETYIFHNQNEIKAQIKKIEHL